MLVRKGELQGNHKNVPPARTEKILNISNLLLGL